VRLACQRFLDDLAHGEERGIFSARRARSTSSIFINLCLTLRGTGRPADRINGLACFHSD
jgi:hypothetical protein